MITNVVYKPLKINISDCQRLWTMWIHKWEVLSVLALNKLECIHTRNKNGYNSRLITNNWCIAQISEFAIVVTAARIVESGIKDKP